MADLLALADRVEKLTGPDREVDAEVMFDLFAKPVGERDDGGPMGYIWPEDNPSWNFGIRFPGKDRNWFAACRKKIDGETLLIERDGAFVLMNSLRVPKLTASLDAAMSLFDPSWAMREEWLPHGTYPARVYLEHRDRALPLYDDKFPVKAIAKTRPTALVAAALRARANSGSAT